MIQPTQGLGSVIMVRKKSNIARKKSNIVFIEPSLPKGRFTL